MSPIIPDHHTYCSRPAQPGPIGPGETGATDRAACSFTPETFRGLNYRPLRVPLKRCH